MFEIYKDNSGEFRFRLKAGNGEPILASEGYASKDACENGIASVVKNSQEDARFELKEAKNGKWHFNLKASNGQIIGTSQMYASEDSAKSGIASVAKNAKEGKINDTTE